MSKPVEDRNDPHKPKDRQSVEYVRADLRQMTYAEAVLHGKPPMSEVETCRHIIECMADDLFNATGEVTDAERALRLAASRIREWRPA